MRVLAGARCGVVRSGPAMVALCVLACSLGWSPGTFADDEPVDEPVGEPVGEPVDAAVDDAVDEPPDAAVDDAVDDAPDEPVDEPALACKPTTCEAEGKNCGMIEDGCGGHLTCGVNPNCVQPETCGGAGVPAVCGIPPAHGTTLQELFARGAALAVMDPLLGELRARNPAATVRGLLIGFAAAEGQTAPGPGKQRIRDSLPRPEQDPYDVAVGFMLVRNQNAHAAEVGAAIAAADPVIGAARNTPQRGALYRLGFDIASGIFGDPALGAQGNTQMGPGAAKIRESLAAFSPDTELGFNDSMALNLKQRS